MTRRFVSERGSIHSRSATATKSLRRSWDQNFVLSLAVSPEQCGQSQLRALSTSGSKRQRSGASVRLPHVGTSPARGARQRAGGRVSGRGQPRQPASCQSGNERGRPAGWTTGTPGVALPGHAVPEVGGDQPLRQELRGFARRIVADALTTRRTCEDSGPERYSRWNSTQHSV